MAITFKFKIHEIFKFFLLLVFIISCDRNDDNIVTKSKHTGLTQRTQDYIWDICRPTSESNATFRASNGTNSITFTPSCGSPSCVDDGSGTLSSQAQVIIVCSGTGTPSWNSGSCTLTLPVNVESTLRQISVGTCQTSGFDFDPTGCPSTPDGTIYIKSQVYPSCAPYVSVSSCVVVTGK